MAALDLKLWLVTLAALLQPLVGLTLTLDVGHGTAALIGLHHHEVAHAESSSPGVADPAVAQESPSELSPEDCACCSSRAHPGGNRSDSALASASAGVPLDHPAVLLTLLPAPRASVDADVRRDVLRSPYARNRIPLLV